jgi:GTPase KRas protein
LQLALAQFLLLSTQKLGLKAKRLFLDDGEEVDDIDDVHDGDTIYVSAGEPFYKKSDARSRVPTYAVAIIGPGTVGKSSITRRFVQGLFAYDYDPTIEDAYRKNLTVDGKPCVLDILDTAGQEDYVALRSTWMRERDGFLLVFSLCDRSTFEGLMPFVEQLYSIHEEELFAPPVVVIGNKSDLTSERQISYEEGLEFAMKQADGIYIECSALTGKGIQQAFERVTKEMRKIAKQKAKKANSTKSKWCAIL